MSNVLECKATGVGAITVGGKEYQLIFPMWAVAQAESAIGRGLRSLVDWFRITPEELGVIMEAGLQKFHKTEAVEIAAAVCGSIGPEQFNTLLYGLWKQTFPDSLRTFEEAVAKEKKSPDSVNGVGS